MRTRTVLVLLGPALAILIALVGSFVWWLEVRGARQAWEAKIAALRDAGEPLTVEDLARDSASPEENAAPLLREAVDWYWTAFPDMPGPTDAPPVDLLAWVTEEERQVVEDAWTALEPVYARLDDAARRPRCQADPETASEYALSSDLTDATDLLLLRVRHRPAEAGSSIETLLRLATAWDVRGIRYVYRRWVLYSKAALGLRAMSDPDHDLSDAQAAAIHRALRRAEGTVLGDVRQALQSSRPPVLDYVRWCTEDLDASPDLKMYPHLERDRNLLRRARVYRAALAELDRIDAALTDLRSVEALRHLPVGGRSACSWNLFVPSRASLQDLALGTLAMLRVARVGLVLHAEIRAGREIEPDLDTYADRFPDGLPLDPYTGRPLRLTTRTGGVWLEPDPAAVGPDLHGRADLREDAMRWFIR